MDFRLTNRQRTAVSVALDNEAKRMRESIRVCDDVKTKRYLSNILEDLTLGRLALEKALKPDFDEPASLSQ